VAAHAAGNGRGRQNVHTARPSAICAASAVVITHRGLEPQLRARDGDLDGTVCDTAAMSGSSVQAVAAELLASELRAGYGTHGGRVDALVDALDVAGLDVDDATVSALLDAALRERRREEATWKAPSDHDRLVAAMTALDAGGIVSREDYGATIRDAEAEVRAEAERIAEHVHLQPAGRRGRRRGWTPLPVVRELR
jgi:predicted nucleic acid-binding protein